MQTEHIHKITNQQKDQAYSVPCLVLIAYSSSIMLMYTILDVRRSNAVMFSACAVAQPVGSQFSILVNVLLKKNQVYFYRCFLVSLQGHLQKFQTGKILAPTQQHRCLVIFHKIYLRPRSCQSYLCFWFCLLISSSLHKMK